MSSDWHSSPKNARNKVPKFFGRKSAHVAYLAPAHNLLLVCTIVPPFISLHPDGVAIQSVILIL